MEQLADGRKISVWLPADGTVGVRGTVHGMVDTPKAGNVTTNCNMEERNNSQ